MSESSEREYIAFLSYRHKDKAVAVRIERSIERYIIPKKFREKYGGKKLGIVFRDEDELPTSSSLSDSIYRALDHSQYLVVVCTPELPQSKWCEREIQYFLEHHDRDRVLPVLVDGVPEESFSPQLLHIYDEKGNTIRDEEPKAANIADPDNTYRKEITRIYARILGCDFDALWQREKRNRVRSISAVLAMVFVVMAGFIGVVLNRNAQISAQNKQITMQNEKITEQNGQITRQMEELQQKNARITEQYTALRQQQSSMSVDAGLTCMEECDITGALQNGLDALLTEDEADLRNPRAELLLGEALGAYTSNLRTRMVYDQASEITDIKKTTDGRYLLLADKGGVVRCLSTEDYRVLWDINVGSQSFDPPVEILLSESGELVLCKTVWNITAHTLADGSEVWRYTLHEQASNRFHFLSGDPLLVLDHCSAEDDTVMLRVLDVYTGALMGETALAEEGETPILNYRQPCYNWAAAFSPEGDRCAVAYYAKQPQESDSREAREKGILRITVFSTADWSMLWSRQIEEQPFSDTERWHPNLLVFYGMEFLPDGSLFCARYRDAYRSLILTRLGADGNNVIQSSFSHSLSIGAEPQTGLLYYRHKLIPMLTDGVRAIVCSERTLFLLNTRDKITGTSVQFSDDILAAGWKDQKNGILRIWTGAGELIEYTPTEEYGIHYNSTIFNRHFSGEYSHTYVAVLPETKGDTGRLGLLAIPELHPGRLLLTEVITDPQGRILPGQPDEAYGCDQIVLTPSGEKIMVFYRDEGLTAVTYDRTTWEVVNRSHIDEYCPSWVPSPLDDTHFLYGVRVCGMDGSVEYLDSINENNLGKYADRSFQNVFTTDGHTVTICLNDSNDTSVASSVWLDGKLVSDSDQLPSGLKLQVGGAQAAGKNGIVVFSGFCNSDGSDKIPFQGYAFGALNATTGAWMVWEDPEQTYTDRILAAGTIKPLFACTYDNGRVCIFQGETEMITDLPDTYSTGEIAALCFVPGDEYLMILTYQARLDIWSLEKQELVFSEIQKPMAESLDPTRSIDMTCDQDRDGRLQVLVRDGVNRPGSWLCIDPSAWVVTARAEDVYTVALGDGKLYALRNSKLMSYPLRDAAELKAWAKEVLEETKQEGD